MTVSDLVREYAAASAASQKHSSVAVGRLRELCGLEPSTPIFDIVLAMEAAHGQSSELFDEIGGRDHSHYPMSVLIWPQKSLRVRVQYDRAVHRDSTADLVAHMVTAALEALPDNLGVSPYDLPVLPAAAEVQAAQGLAGSPLPRVGFQTVHEAIAEQAVATPDAIAFQTDGRQVSYGELERLASSWARALVARGLRPGDRVAILLERTSTTRQGWARSGTGSKARSSRLSALATEGVEIVADVDQAPGGAEHLGGHAAQVTVASTQPAAAALGVATQESVEAAEDAEEEEGQLALLAHGIDRSITVRDPGDRRRADAEDARQLPVGEAQETGGVAHRLGEHVVSPNLVARRDLLERVRSHRLKLYRLSRSNATGPPRSPEIPRG
jgi:non-ribosomal peptide synthetase component F